MPQPPKHFIVEAAALPEIFVKVAEAKRLLETGEASTVNQATAHVGISRSAFINTKIRYGPSMTCAAGGSSLSSFPCGMSRVCSPIF